MITRPHNTSVRRTLAACGLGLALVFTGCASSSPEPPRPIVPLSPEAESGSQFIRGRMLELEGKLAEAVEAYTRAVELDPNAPELRRYLAQTYLRLGNRAAALEHGERAFELDPNDPLLRRTLSALHASSNNLDRAIELLLPAFEAGELESDARFDLMNLHLRAGDADTAMRVAESILTTDLETRAYHVIGGAFEQNQKFERAAEIYRRGLGIDPRAVGLYDALARTHRMREDSAGERAILEEKLGLVPGDLTSLLRIAQIQEDAGERAAAISTLERLTRAHPDHAPAHFRLGFYDYEAERFSAAVSRFERVLESARADSGAAYREEVRYFLGLAQNEAGRPDEALESLALVAPTSNRYMDAHVLMARILEKRGDIAAAQAEVERALEASPEEAVPLAVYLAGLYQRGGDVERATALMRELIADDPDSADLYYDLGVLVGEAGDTTAAVVWMTQALDRDPDHASALNYIGYTWAEKGDRLTEAEEMIRRAIALRPDDGYIIDSLGWVLYQRGLERLASREAGEARALFSGAIGELERALEMLEEDDPVITWHLADAYRSVSRFDDALATYRRALDLEPKEADAEKIRAHIELLELQVGGDKGPN